LAGIYIHIPFCKQACHYCNFHFATSLRYKNEMVAALLKETDLRRSYLQADEVSTIYFGGGTPSLLDTADIAGQLSLFRRLFAVAPAAEITLEANPDDITEEKLEGWKEAGINRLSIGVQSFFEEDLKWMNRAHNADQAIASLEAAIKYFDNITMDLIYGTPHLTDEKWQYNVETAVQIGIPHLSCYALTVEPKTPLHKMIAMHREQAIDPDKQSDQFLQLMTWMESLGYDHYEISSFARPGWRSRHNTAYWQGKHYLGLGPSAHSFDGKSRQWNIANNNIYIDSIMKGMIPFEKEELTTIQQLNEYVMTSLRTAEGLDLGRFDDIQKKKIESLASRYIAGGHIVKEGTMLKLTKEGKLLADGIAAALFLDEKHKI
jgi:oxygen-independent coproporphyrinogen-3 oxidase